MNSTKFLYRGFALALAGLFVVPAPAPAAAPVPAVQREFRAAWVASVSNMNWPSKPGLSVAEQKAELLAIFDKAAAANLNAIILQVRPACDAFYKSPHEPWSEYLTGTMGAAPSPFYDPLEFAVAEAHKRGLELHAWINPYRARHPSGKSAISDDHISRKQPHLVRTYGKHLWLDPSEPGVRDHSVRVIQDIVARYDIDGIHMDDYFYPYKERDADNKVIDFPDEANWKSYQQSGGAMSRNDWRREQVNVFIERCYRTVKETKPWVKFGISPFGIWKPGHPPQIKGLNQYEELYADAKKWFEKGWVDYFVPQLYWPTTSHEQNFPALLKWWSEQNPQKRHLWPGLNVSAVEKWGVEEIVKQIQICREVPPAPGHVHWNITSVARNRGNLAMVLLQDLYAQPALVPAYPWLNATPPRKPSLNVRRRGGDLHVWWRPGIGGQPWQWALQTRSGEQWSTRIFQGDQRGIIFKTDEIPEQLLLRAVSRFGIESVPVGATVSRAR